MQQARRIETLAGLPILGLGSLEIERRPHPLWAAMARSLPENTAVVFSPQLRTGWRVDGQEVTGAWILLCRGSAPMPSWTSASGVASRSGTARCWAPFMPLLVPSEIHGDQPGRPYMLTDAADVRKCIRVLREAVAWKAGDIIRVRAMHQRVSRDAKRRAMERLSAEQADSLRPLVKAAARDLARMRGATFNSINRRLETKARDAAEVENDVRLQYRTKPSDENYFRYMQAQHATEKAKDEARNG